MFRTRGPSIGPLARSGVNLIRERVSRVIGSKDSGCPRTRDGGGNICERNAKRMASEREICEESGIRVGEI